MPKEKITILINSLGGGGAERVCTTLANDFAGRGARVILLVLHLRKATYRNRLNSEVLLKNLETNHARNSLFAILNFIKNENPKCILVFNHQLAVLLVLIRILWFRDFRIISRNINTLSYKVKNEKSIWHKYVVSFFVKKFYRKVDVVISQSEGMKRDLVKNYHIDEKKIVVIHNPVAPEFLERIPKYMHKPSEPYLLCVGRLEEVKCFRDAIECFYRIKPKFPNLRLTVLGDGALKEDLSAYVEGLKLSSWVDFEGFQRDLRCYYVGAEMTLLTSLYEGFPNVLVESISSGTPVVSYDCPSGPDEIIIDGVNGFLVRDRDVQALAAAVERALSRKWDREKILETSKRFDPRAISQMYIDVLGVDSSWGEF